MTDCVVDPPRSTDLVQLHRDRLALGHYMDLLS